MLKILNLILGVIFLVFCGLIYKDVQEYRGAVKDNATLLKQQQKELKQIRSELKLNENDDENDDSDDENAKKEEIKDTTQIIDNNPRLELLSLLSVTVRYFTSITKEQENLIKILENINTYNEASEEEKLSMQRTLEDDLSKLRGENEELKKSREGLTDTIIKLQEERFDD